MLGEALAGSKRLEHLSMHTVDAQDLGASRVAKGLLSNSTLTKLSLRNNEIEESGAEELAKSLYSNRTLKWLDLGENDMGNRGMDSLGRSLQKNSTLVELEMSSNSIDEDGVHEIARALSGQTCGLVGLGLRDNELDNNAARVLIEAIASRNGNYRGTNINSSPLAYLDLRDNQGIASRRLQVDIERHKGEMPPELTIRSNGVIVSMGPNSNAAEEFSDSDDTSDLGDSYDFMDDSSAFDSDSSPSLTSSTDDGSDEES